MVRKVRAEMNAVQAIEDCGQNQQSDTDGPHSSYISVESPP